MASNKIVKVILRSTESHYFYVKKRSKQANKLSTLKKYDPVLQKHVLFKEEKMK